MFGGPVLAAIGLLVGLVAGLGLWCKNLLIETGQQRVEIAQAAAVADANAKVTQRVAAERDRADAALADARRAGDRISRGAADSRRRAEDAFTAAPEWSDSPVPAGVGLLAVGAGHPAGSGDPAAPGGAGGIPGRAGVPGGP